MSANHPARLLVVSTRQVLMIASGTLELLKKMRKSGEIGSLGKGSQIAVLLKQA